MPALALRDNERDDSSEREEYPEDDSRVEENAFSATACVERRREVIASKGTAHRCAALLKQDGRDDEDGEPYFDIGKHRLSIH